MNYEFTFFPDSVAGTWDAQSESPGKAVACELLEAA
jgi:hypothetical protein